VVIGAGISGLTAAYKLAPTMGVIVVEARDRVGGRALSVTVEEGKPRVDMGGQWVGPQHKKLLGLLDELGLKHKLFPQPDNGDALFQFNSNVTRYRHIENVVAGYSETDIKQFTELVEQLDKLSESICESKDVALKEELDDITLARWLGDNVESLPSRQAYDTMIATITGVESSEFSLLFFLKFLRTCGGYEALMGLEGGAQEWRIDGGAQQIAETLVERLKTYRAQLFLDDPVLSIEQAKGRVVVKTYSGRVFKAKYCVCSVPLHLSRSIHFSPPLPDARRQLAMRTPMGSIIKVVVFYKEAFWEKKGLSGEVVSVDGPVRLFFDDTQADGSLPSLVGFLTGTQARKFTGKAEARKEAVIKQIVTLFGEEGKDYVEYVDRDWLEDPFSDGCFCGIMGVAVLSVFGHALCEPFKSVYFAGTATSDSWMGYFEGAVVSGLRASAQILEREYTHSKL